MGPILASFDFVKRLELYETEKPFQVIADLPHSAHDKRSDNLEFEPKQHTVYDMRESSNEFTLDEHGFTYFTHQPKWMPTSFSSREDIEAKYLPGVESLIKMHVEDVDEVFFFDWRLRDADSARTDVVELDLNDPLAVMRPASHVHIDQTLASAIHRIRLQLADDAESLLQGRVRIINVWRPLDHPVSDYPLGVCEAKTVDDADLFDCDVIRVHFVGETIFVAHNEKQRWHYLSEQDPSEVMLLKICDSRSDVATACPHAAFRHPDARPDTPVRTSLEVRALVFSYPK